MNVPRSVYPEYLKRLCTSLALGACCLVLVFFACSSTDDHINVHVTIWDGAVIIDSTTLAVVGWEYDHAQPADAWASSEYSNIYQYLYKYHLEDSSLELVATLSSDASFYAVYAGVLYSTPWVVYATNDGGRAVGMYNLATGENRVVMRGPAELRAISPNAHLLAYTKTTIPTSQHIYDVSRGEIVTTAEENTRFFYVGDSLELLAGQHCGYSSCSTYVGPYDISSGRLDTAGTIKYIVSAVSSDKQNFVTSFGAGDIRYGSVEKLLAGTLELETLETVEQICDDFSESAGTYVFQKARNIYLANFLQGVPSRIILHAAQEEN